ncbi:hypothetical protein FGG79_04005 [Bacillus sp. BHET2]|uniref:glycosyl-4,4'-diaponeurosporenoate acyltransferase CrtO family protein n=1 Tax=Bacillus sp. BHET2 TaxID=2583818 RepID=UPI00110E8BCB|nr:hypothetical protein [Bacillus sp. BHET2]TMU87300.1 hypothetical protein FGG79_04005 [Bacillus sp. BHET2]
MILFLNIIAWVMIHLTVSFQTSRMSEHQLLRFSPLFHPLKVEVKGGVYGILRIKKWKAYIPDAAGWFRSGVIKNEIGLTSDLGRRTFLMEINRAELSHWMQMMPAPLFFIINSGVMSWGMFLYGILFNLPLILVQRFNRVRLLKVMRQFITPSNKDSLPNSKTPIFEKETIHAYKD